MMSSISIDEATEIALQDTDQCIELWDPNDSFIIDQDETVDVGTGWVFSYSSRLWNETHSEEYCLIDAGLVFVSKDGGMVKQLSIAEPIDVQIARLMP